MSFLLLEDGGRALQEDGIGRILIGIRVPLIHLSATPSVGPKWFGSAATIHRAASVGIRVKTVSAATRRSFGADVETAHGNAAVALQEGLIGVTAVRALVGSAEVAGKAASVTIRPKTSVEVTGGVGHTTVEVEPHNTTEVDA